LLLETGHSFRSGVAMAAILLAYQLENQGRVRWRNAGFGGHSWFLSAPFRKLEMMKNGAEPTISVKAR
jgi:hypothetical protein